MLDKQCYSLFGLVCWINSVIVYLDLYVEIFEPRWFFFFGHAPGLELSSDVIEEILGGEPGN
jgi:hypothetical protein